MGLFDDLYAPYHQVVAQPPVLPTAPLPQAPAGTVSTPNASVDGNYLGAILSSLFGPRGGGSNSLDFPKLIGALRNDPVGDANRTGSLPSYAPGSTSPFNTGYFQDANGRAAVEASRGAVGSYANQPVRTAADYAEDTPRGSYSFFGHPMFAPSVGPVTAPAKPLVSPLQALLAHNARRNSDFDAVRSWIKTGRGMMPKPTIY